MAGPPRHVVEHANCKNLGHLFVTPPPGRQGAGTRARLARAYRLCDTCPVLADCRTWALTTPDPAQGLIAGGLDPDERAQHRGPNGSRPPRAHPRPPRHE